MQTTLYSPEDEMRLMSALWTPRIADDPLAFVGMTFPWGKPGTPLEHYDGPRKWQRDVLMDLRAHIQRNKGKIDFDAFRMAVASGRGIGKSALVAWVVLWMLSTRIGGTIVVSANSEAQLRSVTWSELTKWSSMAINAHWFETSATRLTPAKWLSDLVEKDLKKGTRYWYAEGRLWSEERPDAFAGIHNTDGVMLILDESSGIPDPIWEVSQGFFTENTPNRFWLAFSNPRRNTGYFYETFHSKRAFWNTRSIDARTVEGTDKNIYNQIIEEFGEDSYQAHVEVFGTFPSAGDDQFIGASLVDAAMARPRWNDTSAPVIIGVDPARFGSDATVIAVRQGRDIIALRRHRGADTMEVVGHVITAIEEYQPLFTVVDEGGLGAGVVDRLKEQRYRVRPVNFGWAAKDRAAFGNKRADMWNDMRIWLKDASIPGDKNLKSDLTGPMAKPDSKGCIFLESKKEMRARGLASPDAADAIAVTFAFPVGSRTERVDKSPRRAYGQSSVATSWLGS